MNYEQAHKFVEKNKFVSWEGWDILVFRPNRRAYYKKDGVFRNGKWGFQTRVSCDHKGNWSVPNRCLS